MSKYFAFIKSTAYNPHKSSSNYVRCRIMDEQYPLAIGKIVSNLHGLELLIREFLYYRESVNIDNTNVTYLSNVKIGQELPINAFTDYDSLKQLIKRFNAIVGREFSEFTLDDNVVKLRDALAHGRISTIDTSLPLNIVKFSQHKKGDCTVKVEYVEKADGDWLKSQIKLVRGAMEKVVNARQKIQPIKAIL